MKNKLLRLFTVILLTVFSSVSVFAQTSSGDKLYNQGLKLQKTMTVKAQNSAISKFKSAKKFYDSAAKKAQCDQAIEVSEEIKRNLSSPSSGSKSRTSTPEKKADPTLSLSNNSFDLDNNGAIIPVTVTSNVPDWTVEAVPNSDGSTFLTVKKTQDNTIEIDCPANDTFTDRSQNIRVSASYIKKIITVNQKARVPYLDASEKIIEFKKKGGKKNIEVYCDAYLVYENNNDANWYVVSKPDWIDVSIDMKKSKGLIDKGMSLLKGSKQANENKNVVTSNVIIYASQLNKGSQAAETGRKGIIELASGEKKLTITIHQNP